MKCHSGMVKIKEVYTDRNIKASFEDTGNVIVQRIMGIILK